MTKFSHSYGLAIANHMTCVNYLQFAKYKGFVGQKIAFIKLRSILKITGSGKNKQFALIYPNFITVIEYLRYVNNYTIVFVKDREKDGVVPDMLFKLEQHFYEIEMYEDPRSPYYMDPKYAPDPDYISPEEEIKCIYGDLYRVLFSKINFPVLMCYSNSYPDFSTHIMCKRFFASSDSILIGHKNKCNDNIDYLSCLTAGIGFMSCAMVFKNSKNTYNHLDFDHRKIPEGTMLVPRYKLEVLIICGLPSSGKSTLASNINKEYGHLVLDACNGSASDEIIIEALINRQSVVIDACNGSAKERKRFIDIVDSFMESCPLNISVKKRIAFIEPRMKLIIHISKCAKKEITKDMIEGYMSEFEVPSRDECKITKVKFVAPENCILRQFL